MFNQYDDLITIDELCEILDIGRGKTYHLLNLGEIKAMRIGRVWKITKEAVERYIRSGSGL